MAEITAALVKELREKTGAGMMDAKKALVECNADLEQAVDWLRKKGLAKAAKKSGRVAAEGRAGVRRVPSCGATPSERLRRTTWRDGAPPARRQSPRWR